MREARLLRDFDHRRHLRIPPDRLGRFAERRDSVLYRRLIVHGVFDHRALAGRGELRRALDRPLADRRPQVKTTHSPALL